MYVSVELFAFLKKYYPDSNGSKKLFLSPGSTIATLREKLGIPDDLRLLYLVNGQQSNKETVLRDSDEIFIFSPAEGG